MEIFCIIPARGGSKGIPGKNIMYFRGKPLLVHSIEYAKSVHRNIAVFVSTDDEKIARVAERAGAAFIPRPSELAGDEATTESAIGHALLWWEERELIPDVIVLLQPTSPLRPPGSLDAALDLFIENDYDSLLSISPSHRFFWRIQGNEAIPEYDYMKRPRRQDLSSTDLKYLENGSLYIFSRTQFLHSKNRLGGKIGYIIFPDEYSIEIDSQTDIDILEGVAARLEKRQR